MKKYKIRDEVKRYFTLSVKNLQLEKSYWIKMGVSYEALEEVK